MNNNENTEDITKKLIGCLGLVKDNYINASKADRLICITALATIANSLLIIEEVKPTEVEKPVVKSDIKDKTFMSDIGITYEA